MNADTIERARAAIARLRETEREATPGPWVARRANAFGTRGDSIGARQDTDAAAIVALRNAAPALLALAEAVAGLADGDEWWRYCAADFDGGTASCIGCGALRAGGFYNGHASDCPALALDAALAALADDTREVTR